MSRIHRAARLAARVILPNHTWYPFEAWGDDRYDWSFARMRTQPDELAAQRIAARDAGGPVFSIVVPLFKTPREYFVDMADSVLAQTYPNFELVLVNASPELAELRALISDYTARDARVKAVALEGNLGITENTNRGIAAATGDFICFMDHDDWIEPDTLFEYAAAVQAHPDADLLYCDEDLVEKTRGTWHYRHPMFKPEFSPELLLCKNFVVHLLTVRASLIEALPAPTSEFDGAQDYNMTFLASEHARYIHHVPKVLYHWRMSMTSTAANSAAKPYGKRAYRLSAERHMQRTGTDGRIVGSDIVNIHNIWFKPDGSTRVSLVVACADESKPCAYDAFLESFAQVNTYGNLEVLLAGGPAQDLPNTGFPVRRIEVEEGACLLERFNRAAREAQGDALVFLDADCQFVSPAPIEQIVGLLARPGLGIVGPKVLFSDYSVKSYGVGVSREGVMPLYRGYPIDIVSYQCNMRAFQNTSAIGFQGLSVKRADFERLGGFDAGFCAEVGAVALSQRAIEANLRIAAVCTVKLLTAEEPPEHQFDGDEHYPDYPPEEVERLFRAVPGANRETDPFRSPNLDLRSGYPVIDWRLIQP